MADRTVYHVVPDGSDWRVKVEGSALSGRKFSDKDDAISYARRQAKANRPSQVVVHKSDGTIQTEWTYDEDPFPPSG